MVRDTFPAYQNIMAMQVVHNINNLRYADDTVLISENEKDLQQLLNIVESKSKEKGLELNSKKDRGYGNQPQGRAPTHQHYYQRHQT